MTKIYTVTSEFGNHGLLDRIAHLIHSLAAALLGRVPAGCGYCFETSLMPPE